MVALKIAVHSRASQCGWEGNETFNVSSHWCGPRAAAGKPSFHWSQWKYEAVGKAFRKREGLGVFGKLGALGAIFKSRNFLSCWRKLTPTIKIRENWAGRGSDSLLFWVAYLCCLSRYLNYLFLNVQRQRPMCLSSGLQFFPASTNRNFCLVCQNLFHCNLSTLFFTYPQ